MAPVARRLLGEPNKALSTRGDTRYGNKGSVSIVAADGTFYDHEAKAGGGVLDLIAREVGGDRNGAVAWLEREGLIEPQRRERSAAGTFYDYADGDGVIAYRVERRGKGMTPPFLQRGPDGRGGYHAAKGCMHGVTRLPYRLPQLLSADPAAIVFVCEGEKDADRLARDGLVATTNSGGAGKFGPELVPYFAGRRVVVLADNDKAGEDHALDVEAKLRGVAAAVAIVRLSGPEKADVSDWLAAGGSAHQLVHQFAEPALALATVLPETFPIADLAAWATMPPEPKAFVMAGMIPADEVTLFTGGGGTNKSTFGLQLCACSAAGLPMLGVPVRPAPALYVTAEDEERENHWRVTKIAASLGVGLDRLVGRLSIVSLRGRLNNELATFDAEGRIRVAPAYLMLRSTIEQTGAKLVVLDNVGHLFVGNENERGNVTAFLNLLYQLCRELGVTVVLIAHPNKVGDAYSGSTAWLNAVRSMIVLQRPEDGLDPDARVLTVGKANYARPDHQLAFRWHDFALVLDEDLPANVGAELASTIRANRENEAFLTCLDKATEERRATSANPSASSYAPRVFAKMTIGKSTGEAGFVAAMERLLHLGAIRNGERVYQRDNRQWVTGIGRVEGCTNPCTNPAPTARTNPHEAAPTSTTNPLALTPLYTTYTSGAAPSGPPAPDDDGGTPLGLSRVAFPATDDDPFDPRGWEDRP
jgi:RecA-family ATPase